MDHFISQVDADYFAYLEQILHGSRPTVAFVGSGLSRANGYASWEELVDGLAKSVDLQIPKDNSYRDPKEQPGELLRISDEVYSRYARPDPDTRDGRFRKAIIDNLVVADNQQFNLSHSLLVNVNFSAFITTNFDPSIEMAFSHVGKRECHTCTYRNNSTFPPEYLTKSGIYHIHGRLWDERGETGGDPIVFLQSEYSTAYGSLERQGRVAQFLNQVMEHFNIVFVGFGMRDPVLCALLSSIAHDSAFRHFMEERRNLKGASSSPDVPYWFHLVGLRDDVDGAKDQCQIEHAREEPFTTLIHYKCSFDGRNRDEWGLHRLLEQLARSWPYEAVPAKATSVAETEAEVPSPPTHLSAPLLATSAEPPALVDVASVPLDFSKLLETVESVLRLESPSDSEVDWVLSQIAEPAVLDFATRFLETRPDKLTLWFPIFFNARLLSVPPQVDRHDDMLTDGYWYSGRLLMAAAGQGLPLTTAALESVQGNGPNATFFLLRAFLAVSDIEVTARLTPTVVAWLNLWPSLHCDVPGLGHEVVLLLQANHAVEARQLFGALLERAQGEGEAVGLRTARSRVDDFWFDHMSHHLFPRLRELNAYWLIDCLEVALRRVNEWEYQGNQKYQPPAFLPSPGYRNPIEEAGGQHQPFGDQLAGAIRDTLDYLIGSDIEKSMTIVSRWLGGRLLVFRRIALHFLAERGDLLGSLRQQAVRRENILLSDCYHEFWRFLNRQFQFLPQEQKLEVEDWILSI